MNLRAAALALIVFLLLAAPAFAVSYKSSDGLLNLEAAKIDVLSDKLIATGKAHVHWVDTIRKINVNANAEKIVVATMPEQVPAPKAPPAKGAKAAKPRTTIKTATFTGPVTMVYVITDATGKSTITANCDNADFDGIANLGYLVGNVKIVNDNPSMFSVPATMNGDKATINLKPSGPDDFRFRVETSPGVSSITATPKAQKAE